MHSGKLEFLALKWAICDKFRDYLYYSKPFTVFSDNNPLSYVLTTAKLNATGMRWIGELADFNFTIKYRPGKESVDCDYLSRNALDIEQYSEDIDLPTISASINSVHQKGYLNDRSDTSFVDHISLETTNSRISPTEIVRSQLSDRNIKPIYNAVQLKIQPSRTELKKLPKGSKVLYRYWNKLSINSDNILVKKTANNSQIVLPSQYHGLVYTELHQNMGHLGFDRTINLAKQRFYWPGMASDIKNFIQKQCSCVKSKKPNREQRAPLVNITSYQPFEMVSIDYLHLDKCKGGYEYALVVVDHFTRFAQVFPTKNKSGRSAADKIFNDYVLHFGFPKTIHHDQGGEFENKLMKRLQELSGIRSSRTTPYHPMGNGQCERFNRTLINMLKTLSENQKRNWAGYLKHLTFAYNNTIHKATGYTPHYLMFGRSGRLPIDFMFGIDDEVSYGKTYTEFVEGWKGAMKEAYEIASKNANKNSELGKKSYNKKIFGSPLTVGDRVLVRNLSERGGTGKLRNYWEDTVHVVTKAKEDIPIFEVKPENGGKKRILHKNLLLKCEGFEQVQTKLKTKPPLPTPPEPKSKCESSDSESESEDKIEVTPTQFNDLIERAMNSNESSMENSEERLLVNNPTSNTEDLHNSMSDISNTNDDHVSPNSSENYQNDRPKRNRKPRKVFTYNNLGIPSYQ